MRLAAVMIAEKFGWLNLIEGKVVAIYLDPFSYIQRILNDLPHLKSQVREATENISRANSKISPATVGQTATVIEQAVSIAKTATEEEVRQMAEQSVERAHLVFKMAYNTLRLTEKGLDAAKKTEDGILGLKDEVLQIGQTILALDKQAMEIVEIIATVDDIAER
jgi:methyl-accepting chemotaxis protein